MKVEPLNPAGKVLRALARIPEGATAEMLAQHIYRQPRHPPILGTMAEKTAIRRGWEAECKAAKARCAGKISTILRELVRLGFVSGKGSPRVAAWLADHPKALASRTNAEQRLIDRILTGSPPTRAALGLSGRGERVYDALVADGLIVPPSLRVISDAGRALVLRWEVTA